MTSCFRSYPLRGVFVAFLLAAVGLASAESAPAATLPTLSLTINASSITVGGTLQSGGVNVVSTVTGLKEANVVLFRAKPGLSVAEVEAVLKEKDKGGNGDPNADKNGSLILNSEVTSGQSTEVQVNLQPGLYVALAGAGEGPPKFHAIFTVAAAKSPATLPTPQATIRAIDFGFSGPRTLHNGELVGFENEGFLVHMNIAFPARSARAAKQIVKLLLAGKDKKTEKLIAGPPVNFAGPVSSGAYQQEIISAKPGWYVEACFMDTQDGREHTRVGMERIIKITK